MKKYIFLLFLLCGCVAVFAQQKSTFTVSGQVFDDLDMPVPGASVFIKNSPGVGAVTDIDGKFSLKAQKNDVIVVSFLGYKQEEYLVTKSESNISIKLKQDSQVLEETVIVGMGTQRKVSVVGAITNVDIADIQTPATNINNMLGGRIPGVISLQRSGEPGKNISEFWIRGIGTFGANSSALVLIDGLEGNLSEIDPSDIESFSVLKDASATAVYGVRGANGVVLVTTKRGTADKLQITARANWTISHMVNMPEYLEAYDYAKLANEALRVRGNTPLYSDMELDLIKYQLDPDLYPNVNWQKEVLNRNALQQTYYINAKGGGSLARYYLSLGMSNESSAYKQEKSSKYSTKVGYRTYNYRVNLDINLTKTTTVYFGSDGFISEKAEPGNADTDALWATQRNLTPLTIPRVYSTGQLPAYGADNAYSPYVMLNYTGMSNTRHFRGKSTVELKQDLSMVTKGLSARAQIAYDTELNLKEKRYVRPEMYYADRRRYTGELGLYKKLDSEPVKYTHEDEQYYKVHFESMLNYERTFAEQHRLSGLLYYYMSSEQKMNKDIDDKDESLRSMYAIPIRYQGLSGRITYGLRDTYFLDLNFGYTGSANFAKGDRFGFFPAVAVGWVPTGYDWVREKLPWLDFLKIRGSYGMVGDDNVSGYAAFDYMSGYNYKNGGSVIDGKYTIGSVPRGLPVTTLSWIKAKILDVGFDVAFLDNRLTGQFDFFRRQRDGLPASRYDVLLPSEVGFSLPKENLNSDVHMGYDAAVRWTDRVEDFTYSIGGNITYSRFYDWEQYKPRFSNSWDVYRNSLNHRFGYLNWGLEAIGQFNSWEEIATYPIDNDRQGNKTLRPGDIKYKDVNGDGVINSLDERPIGYREDSTPILNFGLNFSFGWKGFDLAFDFTGGAMGSWYQQWEQRNPFHDGGNNPQYYMEDTWRLSDIWDADSELIPGKYPMLLIGNSSHSNYWNSTFWKKNVRYVKLRNLELGYTLPKHIVEKALISDLRFYVAGTNLLTFTNAPGIDPESTEGNGLGYPTTRIINIGVNLKF